MDRLQQRIGITHQRIFRILEVRYDRIICCGFSLRYGHTNGVERLLYPNEAIVFTIPVGLMPDEVLVMARSEMRDGIVDRVHMDLHVERTIAVFPSLVMCGVIMDTRREDDRVGSYDVAYRVTGVLASLPYEPLVLADMINGVEAIDGRDAA